MAEKLLVTFLCSTCNANGLLPDSTRECPRCQGTGVLSATIRVAGCSYCGGLGVVQRESVLTTKCCPSCKGTGMADGNPLAVENRKK